MTITATLETTRKTSDHPGGSHRTRGSNKIPSGVKRMDGGTSPACSRPRGTRTVRLATAMMKPRSERSFVVEKTSALVAATAGTSRNGPK